MRPTRSSLRLRSGGTTIAVARLLLLGVITGCGAPAAAPTPTVLPATSVTSLPAPSPPRPALASPIASPSAIAAAVTPTASSTEAVVDTYEVQAGDTLLTISEQYYGDVSLWHRIYDANKDTIGPDPDKLKIGMKLSIPPKQS